MFDNTYNLCVYDDDDDDNNNNNDKTSKGFKTCGGHDWRWC